MNARLVGMLCAVAVSWASMSPALDQQVPKVMKMTSRDIKLTVVNGKPVAKQVKLPVGARRYLLLVDYDASAASNDWRLQVTRSDNSQAASLAIPAKQVAADRETDVFEADDVVFVKLNGSGPPPRVSIRNVLHEIQPSVPQAICDQPDLEDIDKADGKIANWGKAVAKLKFIVPGDGMYVCTAFKVGGPYVLTNEHCVNSAALAEHASLQFNYDADNAPGTSFRVAEYITSDPALDYSLLRADGNLDGLPLIKLQDATTTSDGDELIIIGHPAGLPKKFSRKGCKASSGNNPAGVTFGHYCDTEGGNSGSPVIGWPTGILLGLHHVGVKGCTDGGPANEAIRIRDITKSLREKVKSKPEVLAAILAP